MLNVPVSINETSTVTLDNPVSAADRGGRYHVVHAAQSPSERHALRRRGSDWIYSIRDVRENRGLATSDAGCRGELAFGRTVAGGFRIALRSDEPRDDAHRDWCREPHPYLLDGLHAR